MKITSCWYQYPIAAPSIDLPLYRYDVWHKIYWPVARNKLIPVCAVFVGSCSFVVSQCCLALLASDVVSVDLLAAAPAAFVPHSSWTHSS